MVLFEPRRRGRPVPGVAQRLWLHSKPLDDGEVSGGRQRLAVARAARRCLRRARGADAAGAQAARALTLTLTLTKPDPNPDPN